MNIPDAGAGADAAVEVVDPKTNGPDELTVEATLPKPVKPADAVDGGLDWTPAVELKPNPEVGTDAAVLREIVGLDAAGVPAALALKVNPPTVLEEAEYGGGGAPAELPKVKPPAEAVVEVAEAGVTDDEGDKADNTLGAEVVAAGAMPKENPAVLGALETLGNTVVPPKEKEGVAADVVGTAAAAVVAADNDVAVRPVVPETVNWAGTPTEVILVKK